MKSLICVCGSMMVSDGIFWRCGLAGQQIANATHVGDKTPDRRIGLSGPQEPKPDGTPGQVGSPGDRQARRKNCKQRRGPMAADFSAVGPEAAAKYRNLRSRFQGGRKTV